MALRLALQEKQTRAFCSRATELLYGGAAGGGKSHLMRVASIIWAIEMPGLQVYLFRRVVGDLLKNHMEGPSSYPTLLAPLIDKKQIKINYSNLKIEFWNGSVIHLCHCQHEKDKQKYHGAEIHVLMFDELTHFTETIYTFLRHRVRMVGVEVPEKYKGMFPRILAASNPGSIGHTWVKLTFIDIQAAYKISKMIRKQGGLFRQFIPARVEDNPALLESDPDYTERLEGLGDPELVRAMLNGDWDVALGAFFGEHWRRESHVIKPFKIPDNWQVYRSFDWGSASPYSVGFWAISNGEEVETAQGMRFWPAGTLVRIAEIYGWNGKADKGCHHTAVEIAELILEKEAALGLKVLPGPADNQIFNVDDEKSLADKMASRGVTWERSNKVKGSRINGWALMRDMMKAAKQTPMEDAGLLVFDTCTHFIRTIPVLPRDENNPEDIDTKSEDHVADESRYMALFAAQPTFVTAMADGGLLNKGPSAIFGGVGYA